MTNDKIISRNLDLMVMKRLRGSMYKQLLEGGNYREGYAFVNFNFDPRTGEILDFNDSYENGHQRGQLKLDVCGRKSRVVDCDVVVKTNEAFDNLLETVKFYNFIYGFKPRVA